MHKESGTLKLPVMAP